MRLHRKTIAVTATVASLACGGGVAWAADGCPGMGSGAGGGPPTTSTTASSTSTTDSSTTTTTSASAQSAAKVQHAKRKAHKHHAKRHAQRA